jgi:hypothetical protein
MQYWDLNSGLGACTMPHFALVIFQIGSHILPRLVLDYSFLSLLLTIAGNLGVHQHCQTCSLRWDGGVESQ